MMVATGSRMRIVMLWAAVLGLGLVAVAITGRSAMNARARAQSQLVTYRTLEDRVREYERLKTGASRWPSRPVEANLTLEVGATVAAAGLPASVLASLSPDTGTALPGDAGLVQLRAGVTLNPVTLPQLGRWLNEWRRRQPGWVVTAIDLSPETVSPEKAAVGGDMPLQAALTLESIVTEEGS